MGVCYNIKEFLEILKYIIIVEIGVNLDSCGIIIW